MFTAHIEKVNLDLAIKKLNLTAKWPVLQKDNEWDESLWQSTEFYRHIVHCFIGTDLKNTSKQAVYVRILNSQRNLC